jgi:hypothetical protein
MWKNTGLGLMAILLFSVPAGQGKAEPVALGGSGGSSLQLLEHVGYAVGGTTSGTGGVTSGMSSLSSGTNAGTSSVSQSGLGGTSGSSGTSTIQTSGVSLHSGISTGTTLIVPDYTDSQLTGGTLRHFNPIINTGLQLPTGTALVSTGGTLIGQPVSFVTLNSDASVPEPSTFGLVASLAGIGVVVWTRRGKSKAGRR